MGSKIEKIVISNEIKEKLNKHISFGDGTLKNEVLLAEKINEIIEVLNKPRK